MDVTPTSGLRALGALDDVVLLASDSPSVQEGEKPPVPRCCEASSPSLKS